MIINTIKIKNLSRIITSKETGVEEIEKIFAALPSEEKRDLAFEVYKDSMESAMKDWKAYVEEFEKFENDLELLRTELNKLLETIK